MNTRAYGIDLDSLREINDEKVRGQLRKLPDSDQVYHWRNESTYATNNHTRT